MGFSNSLDSSSSVLSNNTKVIALNRALQQSIEKFKELVEDFGQLHIDSENYKLQYLSVRDKCKNETCEGSEELKKKIKIKDQIIQTVASMLTKLHETKNINILSEIFNLLFENDAPLTPPVEEKSPKQSNIAESTAIKITPNKNSNEEIDISITEDVSYKEESLCEIEGTPTTGRVSPIIQLKKSRSSSKSSDKKKCPVEWPTSDSKAPKLTPTPKNSKSNKSGKLRQSRLNIMKVNKTSLVDLTCSPAGHPQITEQLIQPVIKKESFENDDTILPSPTSGPEPINFIIKMKNSSKESPKKFKKPLLSLKNKHENVRKQDENKDTSNNDTNGEMEESINILNHFNNRPRNTIKKENEVTAEKEIATPIKKEMECQIKKEKETPEKMDIPPDEDETNASISLLQHVNQLEEEHIKKEHSLSKRPLAENINITNTPPKKCTESSISILQPEHKIAVENVKKRIPELVEPIYKEPTVRKKAEKRNLQGWSCEECMNFYGVLYKDDPVMLARKINECSKHRGKHNPARPKTPPNFWNPRWNVPEDTEELNRMNNNS